MSSRTNRKQKRTSNRSWGDGQRWVDHSVCYFSIGLIIHNVQL